MKRTSPSVTSQRHRLVLGALRVAAFAAVAFHSFLSDTAQGATGPQSATVPGGFIEKTNSTAVRPLLSPVQIQSLLPARGAFVFPPPYNTQAVRITNGTDCGGSDCLQSVGYSYWRNMNNSAGSSTMLIFLGLSRTGGGGGPTLFSYNKDTGVVSVVGPLFDAASPFSWSTGEGWYFSATLPNALYLNSGSSLLRYDVMTHQMQTVFDAAPQFGSDKYIWQVHSSSDDRVHSATLRSSATYEMLGCLAYREDTKQFSYFPKNGDFDECQIDKSGRWLVIKENVDGLYGEDNVIIDLQAGTQTILLDQNGAAGHSDNGYGYMVYSDNWNNLPNAIRVFPFGTDPMQAPLVYNNTDWSASAPAHVSHANAKPATPLGQQYACGSGANRTNSNRANEIICFRLDTSLDVLVVAPVMTDLNASGGGSDDYAKLPKGNLDPTGQYLIWTTNMGGSRQDAFVVKVPSQLLVGAPAGDTTPPVLSAVGVSQITSGGASLGWTTSEAGDSQVEYGPTTAYGSMASLDATLVLSHAQMLSGLAPGTPYHCRARSRDATGNLAVSGDVAFTTATTAVQTVQPSGLVAYWTLDESSGSLALDSSGSSANGRLLNFPPLVPGRLGQGLAFNGVDQGVSVPHAPVLDSYPITVSFWMSTTANSLGGLVNKYLPGSFSGYQVFTSGGSLCAWYFRDASNYVWDGSGCTLATPGFNDGQWHHVAFSVDASGGRLFVDGTLRTTQPWTGTPGGTTTTQGLGLAEYPGTASPFLAGRLDDVRIFNRALGAGEVSTLSSRAAVPDLTPPVISMVSSTTTSAGDKLVKWTTDEPADTQIEYGRTTAYGSTTTMQPSLAVSHSQTLTGLAPMTAYHYRTRSRDQAGNFSVSRDYYFLKLQ
jgi:Concanavalin A-like lectin/glucanases superfamily